MKKGISPLIATVLLIGFVVVVAVLIWFWYSGVVEEQYQKQAAKTEGQFSCASDVEIRVSNAFCNSGTDDEGDPVWDISFDIENTGTASLLLFRVIVEGADGSQTLQLNQNIATSGKISTGVQADQEEVENPSKATIIPVLQGPTSCEQKQATITLTCTGETPG